MKLFYRFKQLILTSGDLISFTLGLLCAHIVRNWQLPDFEQFVDSLSIFFFTFLIWIIINYVNGLYDLTLRPGKSQYRRLIQTAGVSLVVGIIFFYLLTQTSITPKTILLLTIIFGYHISYLLRVIYHYLIGTKTLITNVLFLGLSDEVYELSNLITSQPHIGYAVKAICDPATKHISHSSIVLYSEFNNLHSIVEQHDIRLIVTTPSMNENQDVSRMLYDLLFVPVQITDLTSFYESITGRIPPYTFSETWFLKNITTNTHLIYHKFRRLVDYLSSVVLGFALLILCPFIAAAIRLDSTGPIFYRQKRIGMSGRIFDIYKFRTMHALTADGGAETDGAQFAQKGDTRITHVGMFLRKTRLDELPQVINLIKGDITLIGPRPERPEIIAQLQQRMPYYTLRHIVKPGLTGWAAINQHYTDTLETALQKLQYDLYYIKNRSVLLDLSILFKTINVVLRRMGQ